VTTYHHTIFYPEEREPLDEATYKRSEAGTLKSLPSALLLPHAAYSMIGEALHQTFAHASSLKPELVVFLGPLHQPVLDRDKPAFLFAPAADTFEQAGRTYQFDEAMIGELTLGFPIRRAASYYEEEPAFELTLPFIDSYLAPKAILPLIGKVENSNQIAQLILALKTIVQRQPKVLFVLSANASELLPQREATDEANHFIEDLIHEHQSLGIRSSCNWGMIEAMNRSALVKGRWKIASAFLKGTDHGRITDTKNESGLMTWHIGAYKGV